VIPVPAGAENLFENHSYIENEAMALPGPNKGPKRAMVSFYLFPIFVFVNYV